MSLQLLFDVFVIECAGKGKRSTQLWQRIYDAHDAAIGAYRPDVAKVVLYFLFVAVDIQQLCSCIGIVFYVDRVSVLLAKTIADEWCCAYDEIDLSRDEIFNPLVRPGNKCSKPSG